MKILINLLALYMHQPQPFVDYYQALAPHAYGPDIMFPTPYIPGAETNIYTPFPPVQIIKMPARGNPATKVFNA
jgi:hypothetical protein